MISPSTGLDCLLGLYVANQSSDIISPAIAAICNASFDQVTCPHCCKKAIIRPRLKKPKLDPNDVASYRPSSNLSFLSKVVEKVVDVRLSDRMNRHHLHPVFQSAYRPHQSTETALARIMNDMILVVDDGRVGALTLLDLSAAFDTVDHSVLTNVMRKRFGVSGNVLGWVEEYMRDRSQAVHVNSNKSASTTLKFGVPQGSVPAGPKIFIDYAEDVSEIFSQHDLSQHLFADDIPCLCCGKPAEVP